MKDQGKADGKDRRSLIEGLKPVDRTLEKAFVFGAKPADPPPEPQPRDGKAGRVPLTTRIRSDLAAALKRASLERQLEGVEPNTLQDILEESLEPWLKTNGYLT